MKEQIVDTNEQVCPLPYSDEHVLVVPCRLLASHIPSSGFSPTTTDELLMVIQNEGRFLPRHLMEYDERYKQIIPYLVFLHEGSVFLMQRKNTAREQRLAGKYSIGIGGHVRQEDIEGCSIEQWGIREFYEEVAYTAPITVTPLGIVNDESDAVNRVHLGLVYLVTGPSTDISIASELKSGSLYPLEQALQMSQVMELWSQYVLHYIAQNMPC